MLRSHVTVVCCSCLLLAADYSGWTATSNAQIQYRWRSLTYNQDIPSDCGAQWRYTGDADTARCELVVYYAMKGSQQARFPVTLSHGEVLTLPVTNCNFITKVDVLNFVQENPKSGKGFEAFCANSQHTHPGWSSQCFANTKQALDALELHKLSNPSHERDLATMSCTIEKKSGPYPAFQ